MKKVLGILTTTALALTLAACSGGNNNENNQSQDKTSNNGTSQNKTNENNTTNQSNNQPKSNMNQSSQKEPSVDEIIQNLTDEEKVALALYEPSIDWLSITHSDLTNGQFTQTHNGSPETAKEVKSVSQMILEPQDSNILSGSPSDLKLYSPYPRKTTVAACFVAVTNDQVLIYGTQYPITYNGVISDTTNASHVFNVKDLYNRHSSEDYKGLASKIVIGQAPSEETSQAQDTSSSTSSSIKVTRENVIDLVEDYEGHLLDTNTYTYKEPAQLGDGSWGFSFLDKAGNLAGSYIVSKDGVVTKYDEKGIEE